MKKIIYIFILLILIIAGCNSNSSIDNGNVIARVHDNYLYESDLEGIVPTNASATDSLMIVKNYINNWVRQTLLIHHAEANLPADQRDSDRQLKEYRNSLIMYQYESMLIQQELDTLISDDEIEAYFNDNLVNFELKENILKADYVKFFKDSPYGDQVRSLFTRYRNDELALDSLMFYCENYAIDSDISTDRWILFDDLIRIIPIQTFNRERYLQENTLDTFDDELYTYMINIVEYSIKDGTSPLSYEKENIRQMILNKRKIELINKMQTNIFDNALTNQDVEIY